jgi:AcrR family transcriptional regulator
MNEPKQEANVPESPSISMARTATASGAGTDAGAETRDALLRAARHAFSRSGFDGSSVRTITAEAGVNLGAITYHFGSKRDLYEAVLEAELRPLARRVGVAAGSEGSALDRMVGIVEAYFAHLAEHPELPKLLLQEVAAGKEPPPVVVDTIRTVKATLAGLQREGERDGSVRPGDPVLTALSLVSQPVYLSLVTPLLRSVSNIDLSEPETSKSVVAHATDFARRALEPRHEGT